MGQKVNPIGLRLGGIRSWDSKWYANQNQVPKWVVEDRKIRNLVNKQCRDGSLSHIEIERYKKGKDDAIRLKIYTAKPGLVIGRDGEIKKKLVKSLERLTKKHVEINIFEVKLAERNAQIIADLMARKLEARASFRRVQKLAIQRALKLGAKGIKTIVSGRLGGAEMARAEGYAEGQVPLHTLRADIDYAPAEALTKYGILGVKVWVYQGEVLPGQTREKNMEKEEEKYGQKARSSSRGGRRRERRADNKSGRRNAKPRNQKTQEPKKDVKKDTNKTTKKKEA